MDLRGLRNQMKEVSGRLKENITLDKRSSHAETYHSFKCKLMQISLVKSLAIYR